VPKEVKNCFYDHEGLKNYDGQMMTHIKGRKKQARLDISSIIESGIRLSSHMEDTKNVTTAQEQYIA
jgi:hypothetical protein